MSINTVHPASIDIIHHDTVYRNNLHHDTVQRDPIHRDAVHHGTVHHGTVRPMTDTTCVETEKVKVLILKVDENEMLRDEEGRTRNSAWQLINALGGVIPDVIDVAEMNDFDLSREWYDWVGQDSFQGRPHHDPINHIAELEDLVLRSEQNEVS